MNRRDIITAILQHPTDDHFYKERSVDWAKVTVPFLSVANLAGFGLHPRETSKPSCVPHRNTRGSNVILVDTKNGSTLKKVSAFKKAFWTVLFTETAVAGWMSPLSSFVYAGRSTRLVSICERSRLGHFPLLNRPIYSWLPLKTKMRPERYSGIRRRRAIPVLLMPSESHLAFCCHRLNKRLR
jgi:hypothetical protein